MSIIPPQNVLGIAHIRDNKLIDLLLTSKVKDNHEGILFRRITFTSTICQSLQKALQARRRDEANKKIWKKVELRNVDGNIVEALETCCTSSYDSVQELQLVINHTVIRDDGWIAIANGIVQTNTILQTLRLATTLVPSGLYEFSKGLISSQCQLQTLDFSWCTFEIFQCMEVLASALRNNTSLIELSFMGCSLADSWLSELVEAVTNHPYLQTLNLNSNKAARQTSDALAKVLKTNQILTKLDISFQTYASHNSSNNDERLDIPLLAAALKHNTTLEVWDLSNCQIDDHDIQKLSQVLGCCCSNIALRELCLARNKITNRGIKILAEYLPRMTKSLKHISLWGNPFEDEGAKALVDGLSSNYTIEDIDLFRNFPSSSPQITYYTRLNRAGRRLIHEQHRNNTSGVVPIPLWPIVLARSSNVEFPSAYHPNPNTNSTTTAEYTTADLQYYLLRNNTTLLHSC